MKQYTERVEVLCRVLDRISAFCIAAMTIVVVMNILMRSVLGKPLMGTMDYVNILMTLAISLGLAHCALKNGHIAVEYFVEKLSDKLQAVIAVFINLSVIIFWGAAVWFMAGYARSMMLSNHLAGTVSIPLYPVVYLTAFGLLALLFVIIIKLLDAVRMVFK
ncbi:MAG: TRAP transporter small permease [Syntrophomonadaceae bacterium]|jgi:TRAP-type C4-dicarboxylate transport system permease small subunit